MARFEGGDQSRHGIVAEHARMLEHDGDGAVAAGLAPAARAQHEHRDSRSDAAHGRTLTWRATGRYNGAALAPLPLIPTHVMGSHGFPGWFWTALDKVKAGEYGATDEREMYEDATQLAIRDQERAGIDVICDGEMRRFFFVQTFYGRMEGLEPLEPLRKTGLYAYDSVPRYRAHTRVRVPKGLGTVEEFRYLKTQTDKPVKATVPGPVTLSIHIQTRPGDGVYNNDRLAMCWDMVPAVNAELKALVEAGAEWIQLDEPSAAIVPGQVGEYVKMFNACVDGVRAKIGYHVCFGNLLSRPRGKRSYRWMFPALLDCRCDQFVFEYANREMAEIEMWRDVGVDREIACGVIDVKSFYMESAEDVADRLGRCLEFIPAEKLSAIPDCGFFPVPRWVAAEKLKRLVAGTKLVRARLTGGRR
jgi:5-methyltetrahydropteroyltriglutamate--homocysteine methyltransferase